MNLLSAFVVSSELIAPITSAIDSGLAVLIPVGIGIMATFLGISLIPKVIYRFF